MSNKLLHVVIENCGQCPFNTYEEIGSTMADTCDGEAIIVDDSKILDSCFLADTDEERGTSD